jgi:hypothetical protein
MSTWRCRMKPIFALITWLLALPIFALAPAHAQDSGQKICPPGYAPVGEVCVSETTGDVVLPSDKK